MQALQFLFLTTHTLYHAGIGKSNGFKAFKAQFYRKILLKPELRFFGIVEKLDLEFLPRSLCLNIGDY